MESVLYAAVLIYIAPVLGLPVVDNLNIKNGTWLQAFRDCNRTSSHLPAYKVAGDHKDMGLWMDQRMISTLWLSLNKTRFPTWMWLDNQPVDHEFSKQNWRDFMNCGVLHLRDKAIEVDRCSKNDLGYVCTSATVSSCMDGSFHQSDCTHFDQHVYVYGCGAENWYDARHRCKKDHMDLALMRSEPLMRHLHQVWYKSIRKKCTKLWMGLRRNDWKYQGVASPSISSWQSFWAFGEPSDAGSCAIISKRAGSDMFKWYAENCNNVQNWFCIPSIVAEERTTVIHVTDERSTKKYITTETVTRNTFNERNNRDPVTGSNGALIAVIIILVIIATGAIVIVLLYRRRQKRRKQSSKYDEDASLVAMENSDDVKLMLPNSEISLMPLGRLGPASNILKINATMKPEFHIPDTEKLLTPIVNVFCGGHKSNDTLNLRDQLELVIPHRLNIHCAEKYIIVYTSKVGCKDWVKLETGPDRKGMQQISAVIENDHILVCFDFPIAVMCTCIREVIPALNLTAVLFYKYYKEESFQEMNVKLYFVDSLYTISDCIRTLEDERYSYEIVHVKPSAVQGNCGTEKIKIDFGADDGWNVKNYDETGTENRELKDLQPTSKDPIGVKAGNWFVQRNDEKESLRINLRVYVPEENDVLCEHVHHFYPLVYEDKYEQETSDKQPASSQ